MEGGGEREGGRGRGGCRRVSRGCRIPTCELDVTSWLGSTKLLHPVFALASLRELFGFSDRLGLKQTGNSPYPPLIGIRS